MSSLSSNMALQVALGRCQLPNVAFGHRRFVMGSNKVLQIALGKTEVDEYKPDTHRISERCRGCVGLFFTRLPHDEARSVARCAALQLHMASTVLAHARVR
jgi:hypothetical protein